MKLIITNAERAGLALWLSSNWGGDEAVLNAFLDLTDALELETYWQYIQRNAQGAVGYEFPAPLTSATATTREITDEAAKAVLQYYPGAATPSPLGPAKVRLLRKLRSAIGVAEPEKKTA